MSSHVCCFIGHREIEETDGLKNGLAALIEALIREEGVEVFLFGSRGRFNALCYETVSHLQQKYPHIKRVYVRAEYPYIQESYETYLLKQYEESYFPPSVLNAGRASYVERNEEMIRKSDVCVFYVQEENPPAKSGAKAAFAYALAQKKRIVNVWNAF